MTDTTHDTRRTRAVGAQRGKLIKCGYSLLAIQEFLVLLIRRACANLSIGRFRISFGSTSRIGRLKTVCQNMLTLAKLNHKRTRVHGWDTDYVQVCRRGRSCSDRSPRVDNSRGKARRRAGRNKGAATAFHRRGAFTSRCIDSCRIAAVDLRSDFRAGRAFGSLKRTCSPHLAW
jgi:hypothetical protein